MSVSEVLGSLGINNFFQMSDGRIGVLPQINNCNDTLTWSYKQVPSFLHFSPVLIIAACCASLSFIAKWIQCDDAYFADQICEWFKLVLLVTQWRV